MKTFKEYRQEKHLPLWDGSFASHRKMKNPPFPFWSSGFAENRGKRIQESYMYDESFHDHPDVKPKNLTQDHIKSIKSYTSQPSEHEDGAGSSKNINYYLSNRYGNKNLNIQHHKEDHVHECVKNLSSVFTPENTNRKHIETFGAVPPKVGELLEKSNKGQIHTFPSFTSTSSGFGCAVDFCYNYHDGEPRSPRVDHIIKYHVKPGAGLSVVEHAKYPENEVLIHHGAKVEYSHTENIVRKSDGIQTKIHHVTVHNEHEPIENYGHYTENENI